MHNTQFWNYLPNTAAMGFYQCSDWDLFGNEAHEPVRGGVGILGSQASAIRVWGGNIGYQGAPVVGSGITLYGTTAYVE